LDQRDSAISITKARQARSVDEMRELVLRAPSVQAAIKAATKPISAQKAAKPGKPNAGNNLPPPGSLAAVELHAKQIFDRLAGEVSMDVISGMGWMLKKIWRRLYQNIEIDMAGLQVIRELAQRPGSGPLLFMPTHRSYLDFLVISYICFTQDLPIPCIAAGEDFLGIMLVRWLFRKSGAFFIRRSFSDDPLYTAIFSQYIEQLLVDGHSLEFFIEGTRARSGKMLQPRTGMMSAVAATLLDRKVTELNVLPITINYERTMESNLYSNELLGERKIKESLANLLKSSPILNNKFGNITVRFATPISMKQFAIGYLAHHHRLLSSSDGASSNAPTTLAGYDRNADKDGSARRGVVRALSYRLTHDLNVNSECMPTHLVAALMLMYRQGITREELVNKVCFEILNQFEIIIIHLIFIWCEFVVPQVDWLRRETIARGGRVALAQSFDRAALVDIAVRHLGSALSVRRSGVLEANIGSRALYNNMLVLGQYRNKIVHLYFRDAVWAVTLYAHLSGSMNHASTPSSAGIPKSILLPDVKFLTSLLDREFIYKASPDEEENVEVWLSTMQLRGILNVSNDSEQRVSVAASGETMYSFLCAMLWPFVDSYYAATLLMFSLQPNKSVEAKMLLQRCQWLATTLYHEQMLCFYEACSNDTLQNALFRLQSWKVCTLVRPNKKDTKASYVQLMQPYQSEDKLNELVARIEAFRKPAPVRRSAAAALRGNLVADIPILAKL
jgi:glycerol-3-phosphate O-acyltransferase